MIFRPYGAGGPVRNLPHSMRLQMKKKEIGFIGSDVETGKPNALKVNSKLRVPGNH